MMPSIGEILADCPGMLHREYFFSERDGQWVAHITWVDDGRYQLISSQDG
jgi:hypothetical protein